MNMKTITLNNDIEMPVLGLGVYQLHGKECERCVSEAVEIGYRLFDTAQMYGNEKSLGNALKYCGIPRNELFITTKLYSPSRGYELARSAIEESLDSLQTDYIDLLLIHEPYKESAEMYRAMREAYQNGKLRAIGISNFNEKQYLNFIRNCEIIPVINQVEAHVVYGQSKLQTVMAQHGTHMEAWSPFAAGKGHFFENDTLCMLGRKYGKSAAQIGLRFLIQRGVIVIPKTSHKERLKENMDIFDFELSAEDIKQLEILDKGKSLFGWYS